uniref:Conotoxin n=1 Tax=Conus praecellens TaxID=128530 RepID=A0A291C2G7_CONPC|nr:conotoxin [Conus praecellens]
MASVQSVTCCCLLWLMLSVQLVNPGSSGTAQFSGHRTARDLPLYVKVLLCHGGCNQKPVPSFCDCSKKRDVVSSSIRRRKRPMAV